MNQYVSIPSGFFLKEAKQEYCDYQTRLIVELLQNSLDAGATEIRLRFDLLGYSCDDNGRGMTRDRMISALLTMGGTAKEQGSTGGFGAAKKLLLFAHASYAIHSNDTAVEGAGLCYKFVENTPRVGTIFSAVYLPEFVGNPTQMTALAERFLAKCDFKGRCRIYVNGVLFKNYFNASYAKTITGLGDVYASRRHTDNNTVIVRHNGLLMFDRYVSDLRRDVIVEIVGNSVDMFTQNRDGLKGNARNELDKLITELCIEKESFIKAKPRKFVIAGASNFISHITNIVPMTTEIIDVIKQIQLTMPDMTPAALVSEIKSKVGMSASNETVVAIHYIERLAEKHLLAADFHFDLADSSYTKVPFEFMPKCGKKKYTVLAGLWKVCLKEVFKANDINQNFTIGFTFDSNVVAVHQKKDGISRYLLNPRSLKIDISDNETKVMNVLTTAIHEVCHSLNCTYHDEIFISKFHELLVPTLTKGPGWRQLLKLAKLEKI